jgi:hypothetical protein
LTECAQGSLGGRSHQLPSRPGQRWVYPRLVDIDVDHPRSVDHCCSPAKH